MNPLTRLEPPPRLVDWSLLAGTVLVLLTGLVSFVAGSPEEAWVFVVHGVAGVTLALFLGFKLRRVRARLRLTHRSLTVALSALLAVATLGAVVTGVWWAFGGTLDLGPWGLLNLHIGLGFLAVPLLAYHLARRFHLPRRTDWEGRRTALQYGALVAVGAVAWRSQQAANRLFDTAGADHRFTGSREVGSGDGNAFPVTSWVLDDPDPIDAEAWSLRVEGLVEEPLGLGYGAFVGEGSVASDAETRAVLDCTSGWFSEHGWRGVHVGDLLDAAGVREGTDGTDGHGGRGGANWVQFRSVTGYRWSLPIDEARDALLATHVDGARLGHGHGFPIRLVAPGRRGFNWVKWVEEVRVTRRRDKSEWLAIFVSGVEE